MFPVGDFVICCANSPTMKHLMLMRHGKSVWGHNMNDIDRRLATRGEIDAELVATQVKSTLPNPLIIISSTAVRAAETALIFARTVAFPADDILWNDDVYTFNEVTLESIIRSIDDNYQNVILFGHNEAITNFVNKFGNMFIDNVPTSGFVSMKFDCAAWSRINQGQIDNIVFPRDLKT